ncbi:MAG: hypothetical protein ACYTBJ_00700 [Planctomycetota bacterium]|jgi:hypothetical protein
MDVIYCEKHISVPTKYVKDDGTEVNVECPHCADLLKASTVCCHRELADDDFKFPEVDERYLNLLLHILECGSITVRLPNDRSISLFEKRYGDLKGKEPNRNNGGYFKQQTPNDATFSYSLAVCVELTGDITIDDFWFSASKDFQREGNTVKIADNKWCHALLQMGFDLGRAHNETDVLKWIEERL